MSPSRATLIALAFGLGWVSVALAEAELITLRNNPFDRPPAVLAPPPPPPPPSVDPLRVREKIELELTATMVSDTTPMAVVDGELIGIGEKVRGLKLIAVMEGKAVFVGNGRKFTFEIDAVQPK